MSIMIYHTNELYHTYQMWSSHQHHETEVTT